MIFPALKFVANVSPVLAILLAQIETTGFANYGVLGVVLGWFMLRAEKWFARIYHQISSLNKTLLIDFLSRPGTSESARRLARTELRKMDPSLADEIEGE